MTLRSDIIGRADELAAIEPEWWSLWHRTPEATPFQSPAWLLPWWRHFAPGRLATIAVRDDGELVGLAAFYLEDGSLGRRMLPLGIGISDFLDVLLLPGRDDVDAALAAAFADIPDWDSVELEELAPGAACLRLPTLPGCREEQHKHSACPGLSIAGDADESGLPFALTAKKRQSFRRCLRALGGELAIAEPDSEAFLDTLAALHAARWRDRGEAGVLADPRVLAFHRDALPRLAAAGFPRLSVAELGGRPIAAYYRLHWRDRAAAYLSGFDPAFARESPLTVLIGHGFRAALREGVRDFSFLRGQEEYKYLWGAADRHNRRRSFRRLPA